MAAIRARGLLRAGDRVVVAVSGGADSMALLEFLAEARHRLGLWLCVAHLNHGLRGQAAEDDARFVAARAEAQGLPARLGAADVAAERRRCGGSVEMAARRARYAFLESVAADVRATRVALAHTADDQVETILLRLLRGGGLDALRGMPESRPLSPRSRASLVRPLLAVTRPEVLDYLEGRAIAWCDDATNADPSFQRNWVRHELLPLLERHYGEGLREDLLGLGDQARELAALVARDARELLTPGPGLDVAMASRRPSLVRRAAARLAYAAAGGAGELPRRALDAVERLLDGGSGRRVTLADGIVAERAYHQLRFGRPPSPPGSIRAALDVPGRVELPELGLWVEAAILPTPAVPHTGDRWSEVVDLDRIGDHLLVRTRQPGDRFVPLGLGASKKLKDFFIDARVPRHERDRALVVAGASGIAWVVGHRLDDRAKVTPATRRFARLRAGTIPDP